MRARRKSVRVLLLVLTAIGLPQGVLAQIVVSADITTDLGGVVQTDESAVLPDTPLFELNLGALADEADVDAVSERGTLTLMSFDTATELPGGITAAPGDVVAYDGTGYSIEFDAEAENLPEGVRIDAVSNFGGDLLVSFDTTVDLGAGLVPTDEDLVRYDGVDFVGIFFDGSAHGVDPALDLDGAHRQAGGTLLLSFDGSGQVGGVDFDDEDVLGFAPATGTWTMNYDASVAQPGLANADVDSVHFVPEPGVVLGLFAGIGGLAGLNRARQRSRRP